MERKVLENEVKETSVKTTVALILLFLKMVRSRKLIEGV